MLACVTPLKPNNMLYHLIPIALILGLYKFVQYRCRPKTDKQANKAYESIKKDLEDCQDIHDVWRMEPSLIRYERVYRNTKTGPIHAAHLRGIWEGLNDEFCFVGV